MKKFSAIIFALILISANASASGLFIGADALFTNARHQVKNTDASATAKNGDKKDDDKIGYGINAGYRFDPLNLYIAPEIFYDHLNTSSRNFTLANNQTNNGDNIELKDRYGAKLNAGLAIFPGVTPFLTYGFANVHYKNNVSASGSSVGKSELTPLYGFGLLVDLPFLNMAVKASYDYQNFNMEYAQEGSKIRTHLGVARLGVIYKF